VQNNKLAISVPFDKQVASKNIAVRAESYGMLGLVVDGNDPLEVFEAMKKARERAVNKEGPTLIEAETIRLTAHSSDDNDQVYRSQQELETAKENDCLLLFEDYLKSSKVLTEEIKNRLLTTIKTEIDEATEYAEQAPFADPTTLLDYVYE